MFTSALVCLAVMLLIGSVDLTGTNKINRLDRRVRILEDKVDLEVSEIREGMESVVKLLNDTVASLITNGHSFGQQNDKVTEKDLTKMLNELNELKTIIVDKSNAIWVGLSNEKSFLRRHTREVDQRVDILNASLSIRISQVETNFDSIVSRLENKVMTLVKKIDTMNDNLTGQRETMNNVDTFVRDIKISNRNIETSIDNQKQKISSVSKALDILANEGPSIVDARINLLVKFGLTHWGVSIFGSSYYFVVDENLKWEDAKNKCESVGAYLVEIDSKDELKHVESMLSTEARKNKSFWLGGSDIDEDGTWIWSFSKTPLMVTNWRKDSNEPNGKTSENCVHMNAEKYDRSWNDLRCSYKMPSVCEVSL